MIDGKLQESVPVAGRGDGEPSPAARPLAVFDLDGTLVRGDTFLPFLVSYAWRRRRFWPLIALPFYLGLYVCRVLSDHAAKERVLVTFLRGQSASAVAEHAEWFCQVWVRRRLRDEVVGKLREHQQAGHQVVLLSASPDVYVPAVGRLLGVDEVVCTRVASAGGCWDGQIVGANCKGLGKLERLKGHLGLEEAPDGSCAYGDSRSDLPLLRWVSHGFLVRRGRLLAVPGAERPAPGCEAAGTMRNTGAKDSRTR